jgi:hypothetical protein
MQSEVNANTNKIQAERLVEDAELLADAFAEDVERYHRQRMALEAGGLSEDLLPVSVLLDIMSNVKANKFNMIARPEWYYQSVRVNPMWKEGKMLVFSLDLPLIGDVGYRHYTIEAYPIPQEDGTITVLQVTKDIAMDTEATVLMAPKDCYGQSPMMCSPTPIRSGQAFACERGILMNYSADRQRCIVKVEKTTQVDNVWLVGPNKALLSTWGDEISENCNNNPTHIKLSKGVYWFNLTEGCTYYGQTWYLAYTPKYTQMLTLEVKPLPNIPPVDLPHFANLTGWIEVERKNFHNLGQVKHFTIETLGSFKDFKLPVYKQSWLWVVVGSFLLILTLCVAGFLYYYFQGKGIHPDPEATITTEEDTSEDPSPDAGPVPLEKGDAAAIPSVAEKEQILRIQVPKFKFG